MRIAICDDEATERQCIKDYVLQYFSEGSVQTVLFSSAKDLLEAIPEVYFDLVLLDIEMEHPTGFEAAEVLKKADNPPCVIFVTKSQAYSVRGYGLVFRYLVKPLTWTTFCAAMDAFILEYQANTLSFRLGDSQTAIPIKSILYIESFNHTAVVHTKERQYTFRATLSELSARLPKGCFAVPQKSYLVNMHYILTASATDVVLENGEHIPISRRKRADFDRCFNDFLGR